MKTIYIVLTALFTAFINITVLSQVNSAQNPIIWADVPYISYLFRDYGSVGRIPYLVPMKWEDGWPVIGTDDKVPETLDVPASKGFIPGIVASDEFNRKNGEPPLPLETSILTGSGPGTLKIRKSNS